MEKVVEKLSWVNRATNGLQNKLSGSVQIEPFYITT